MRENKSKGKSVKATDAKNEGHHQDLAELIAAVLRHPETPPKIYNALLDVGVSRQDAFTTGELIFIDFRPEGAREVEIGLPAGYDLQGTLGAVLLPYSWRRIGCRKGDWLITLQTDDIREGDYVEIENDGTKLIGQYHFEDAVHYSIQTIDGPLLFQVNVRPILGRVVGIWRERAQAYVHREGIFRPLLRKTATLYQFKGRA